MALIICPECEKDISDTIASCPHCGYKTNSTLTGVKASDIGILKKNTLIGIPLLLFGTILLLFLFYAWIFGGLELFINEYLLLLYLITVFPYGILTLIIAAVCIANGWHLMSGWYKPECPYCGKVTTLSKTSQNCKCKFCKKVSVRKANMLVAVQ